MRAVQKISDDWVFHDHLVPELIAELWDGEAVSLPHNAVKLPFNYFDEKCYQHAFIYQKKLPWQTAFEGKEVVLRFDAAMADAVVCLNGKQVAAHKDGYTPFEARLTPHLKAGENLLTVKAMWPLLRSVGVGLAVFAALAVTAVILGDQVGPVLKLVIEVGVAVAVFIPVTLMLKPKGFEPAIDRLRQGMRRRGRSMAG